MASVPVPPSPRNASQGGAEQTIARLEALARQLEKELTGPAVLAPAANDHPLTPQDLDIARSLFNSLQSKHRHTAAHSARVLVGCSAWSDHMGLSASDRDAVELSALLHDIGKICVPDSILLKPGRFTPEEVQLMDRCRRMGLELVRDSLPSPKVAEVVNHLLAWYDGSRYDVGGQRIPLGARMLSIMDAFDAMTTDQVYRRALSQEQALHELYQAAGQKFDPELVGFFKGLQQKHQDAVDPRALQEQANHWLDALSTPAQPLPTNLVSTPAGLLIPEHADLFQKSLLDNLSTALVFVDGSMRITFWNHAAEQLTGLLAVDLQGRWWNPSLIDLRLEHGTPLEESDCPLTAATREGSNRRGRFLARGAEKRNLVLEIQTLAVRDGSGLPQGGILMAQDVTPAVSLEFQCRDLGKQLTEDPLTGALNRGAFDRSLDELYQQFVEAQHPFCLALCDLDHFKKINDTFGHQAGDDVLKAFSGLLKRMCRTGDMVARYGGEEFAMLLPDIDLATAAARCEAVRSELQILTIDSLKGKRVTASFGVTEVHTTDTPQAMLRRADIALYCAKDNGRNNVVSLAAGHSGSALNAANPSAAQPRTDNVVLTQHLGTDVPLDVTVRKLSGFIEEQQADVLSIEERRVLLRVGDSWFASLRRRSDRSLPLTLELLFEEVPNGTRARSVTGHEVSLRTRIRVIVRARTARERRKESAQNSAGALAQSLRSYLMVHQLQVDEPQSDAP